MNAPDIRIPALTKLGHDVLTGGIAPPGRQSLLKGEVIRVGEDEEMTSLYSGVMEIADMWQPGAPDCGITATGATGQVLPRIDSIEWHAPLVDVTGASLRKSDKQLEIERRDWYAQMMRGPNRLTPVHDIIGKSEAAWHVKPMPSRLIPDRDAWRARFWEPERFARMLEVTRPLYTIGWDVLPEAAILAPVQSQLSKAEHRHANESKIAAWDLKLRRARSDLEVIREIARACEDGDLDAALKAHAQLARIAKSYEKQMSKIRLLTGQGLVVVDN